MIKKIIYICFSMLISVSALAHASLQKSNIAEGDLLSEVPDKLDLVFSGNVGLAALSILDSSGNPVGEQSSLPRSLQKRFSIPVPDLSSGAYKIEWKTMSSDGHIMSGHINFMVK